MSGAQSENSYFKLLVLKLVLQPTETRNVICFSHTASSLAAFLLHAATEDILQCCFFHTMGANMQHKTAL